MLTTKDGVVEGRKRKTPKKKTVASTKCSQREGVLNFGPENLANLFDISFSKMLLPFQMLTLLLMC